ncbi:hypothetical protein [Coleofasciculus sp. E1-EBD-02]|uniref:hypothetical protein n=1 Tax=Coleofasciculus sp. E1-EBD-02 TaxID=3068481 RepID=UPI0032F57A09
MSAETSPRLRNPNPRLRNLSPRLRNPSSRSRNPSSRSHSKRVIPMYAIATSFGLLELENTSHAIPIF